MSKRFPAALTILVLVSFAATISASNGGISANASEKSIDGAGRNIMRTADGGIVAAFGTSKNAGADLVFTRSVDNGQNWDGVVVEEVTGTVKQVAVDSNFNGSYVAFTEESGGRSVGRIAYFSAPFADDPNYVVSPAVTPAGVVPHDTSIQASRAGWGDLADKNRETVAYGWQDARSKGLYIGVSPDGRTFPLAKLVVMDRHATSGPAVAIRGNYVIATYQTTNPLLVPADVPAAMRAGRSFPAWIESTDGGATWTKPAPLFGRSAADFPTTELEVRAGEFQQVRLAGGTRLPNSPILNWASAANFRQFTPPNEDKTTAFVDTRSKQPTLKLEEIADRLGGTTFVQTSMMGIDVEGRPGEVSIVSFRPIQPSAKWTHVIANNKLTERSDRVTREISKFTSQGSQFQYSALVDTAVRATIYKELDVETDATRLVAAVSTDTGKTFKHHLSFSQEQLQALGIENFDEATVFAASQCLFEDRDGQVYADIIVSNDAAIHYARVPIGVNAAALRAQE